MVHSNKLCHYFTKLEHTEGSLEVPDMIRLCSKKVRAKSFKKSPPRIISVLIESHEVVRISVIGNLPDRNTKNEGIVHQGSERTRIFLYFQHQNAVEMHPRLGGSQSRKRPVSCPNPPTLGRVFHGSTWKINFLQKNVFGDRLTYGFKKDFPQFYWKMEVLRCVGRL